MLNAFVIVWRESLEAMLVIGVLLAWIGRQPEPDILRHRLWVGLAAGILLAASLGGATFALEAGMAGEALEAFQLALLVLAAGLMLQMVLWMHRHGRRMRRQLEDQAGRAGGGWGLAAIAALAVAREGAETVVFLYGLGLEGDQALPALAGAALAGLLLAAVTAWLVARGARFLPLPILFRGSEILLLLIANAMLATAIDRLVGLDYLPTLLDPAWDTSSLLGDGSGPGRILADFAGYRARPSGILVAATLAYWSFALWRLRSIDRRRS